MKHDTTAEISLTGPPGYRPSGRFVAQAKLQSDPPDCPYGQWDLVVEPVAERIGDEERPGCLTAFVAFLSPSAPHSALRRGAEIGLFRGTTSLGRAVVLAARYAPAEGTVSSGEVIMHGRDSDRDFVAGAEEAAFPRE